MEWKPLAKGLAHAVLQEGMTAFRIDLAENDLVPVEGKPLATVDALARGRGALLAVNGGFFDAQGRPMGLLVSKGRILSRLRRVEWGVLAVDREGRATVVHAKQWAATTGTLRFAIEAGPRLVVDGKPLTFKPQVARRTALGVLPGGRALVLVVTSTGLSTAALAELFAKRLGCPFALNLDGGSSTQLVSPLAGVPRISGKPVANAVLVLPRR